MRNLFSGRETSANSRKTAQMRRMSSLFSSGDDGRLKPLFEILSATENLRFLPLR